jgi:uncharacterized damage-inducible protein DinB
VNEIERIKDQLTRGFDGDAWYGPSLADALADVPAEQAAARSLPHAHSIWEIVLHVAAWENAVRTRLETGLVDLPAEGDWPIVGDTSARAWSETLARLERGHRELSEAIARLGDDRLEQTLGSKRDRPTGGGVSVYTTLHGVIQHTAYHTGQIALLKKASLR